MEPTARTTPGWALGSLLVCAETPKQSFCSLPEVLNAEMRNVFSYCFRKPLGEGERGEEIESEATIYLMLKGTARIPGRKLDTEPSSIWKTISWYSWSLCALPLWEEGESMALSGSGSGEGRSMALTGILVLQRSFSAW